MGAYLTEVLAFVAFVALVAVVPYVRRKRAYWTSKGVQTAAGGRALAATLPGVRLDDRALSQHRRAAAEACAVLGLHDAGRPCALACDPRVAADALGNDGFAEPATRGGHASLIPRVVDADAVAAVMPAMDECARELITSLEAVANRQLTVAPWPMVKKCSAATVATCVYGQPMIDSRINAFADQCDRALSKSPPPAVTDYFDSYDLTTPPASTASVDFKLLLRKAAAASENFSSDVVDKQVRLDMFEFVTSAIEPTAALVTAALYELSRNQNVQNRLREHLDNELDVHRPKITIDQLDRLSFLENVLRETLRKYPLVAVVRRVTTKPYAVPDGSSVTLEPGTLVVVPVHAFHHDDRYYATPEAFQPHRFPGQLSSAYMPFSTGPKSYIGKNFVLEEAKLIVALLVSRYVVQVNPDEPGRSPDPFDRQSFADVRVKFTNRCGVREAVMSTSLRKIHSQEDSSSNKKFLFF